MSAGDTANDVVADRGRDGGTRMSRGGRRRWALAVGLAVGAAVAGCGTTAQPGGGAAAATAAPPAGANGSTPTRRATPDEATGADLPALPDEGERSSSPETTDWVTETGSGRNWLLDPCSPTSYPTDAIRTGFKTVMRTGPEFSEGRQLATYADVEDAAEVMAGFRRALTACSTGSTARGSRWQWVTREEPALGDDGLLAASTVGGPGFSPAGERIAVTRTGSSVFLAYSSGESSAAEIDGAAEEVRRVAEEFLASV